MTNNKLKEIAAQYDFVIAENESEYLHYASLGYSEVDFMLTDIVPELFLYAQEINFYKEQNKSNAYKDQKILRLAA